MNTINNKKSGYKKESGSDDEADERELRILDYREEKERLKDINFFGTQKVLEIRPKRILHLTIKYKWFVEIAEGRKPYEFREVKPYWTKRLFNSDGTAKEFDEIHIRNGYTMDRPFMRSQWWGFHTRSYDNEECYAIDVGDIIEVRNKVLKKP